MSTSCSNEIYLRPYEELDISVPPCGIEVLPGRIAALTHPLNCGRKVILPDREWYDPDVCTVVSSGVSGFSCGDVIVLAPDHGAFYPSLSPDGREARLLGVVKPWWESVLGKLSPSGFAPAPGWMLVDRELVEFGSSSSDPLKMTNQDSMTLVLPETVRKFSTIGKVMASCGDNWSRPHEGERVSIDGFLTYTFREVLPESWALVRAPITSRSWLRSLSRLVIRANHHSINAHHNM